MKITLEKVVAAGYTAAGTVGVAYPFLAGPVPLSMRVRVLGEDFNDPDSRSDDIIWTAPYSLEFLSTCCSVRLVPSYSETSENPFLDQAECSSCEENQLWTSWTEPLSVLGSRRDQSLGQIASAYEYFTQTESLKSLVFAVETLQEIERVRAEYFTRDWIMALVEEMDKKVGRRRDETGRVQPRIPIPG